MSITATLLPVSHVHYGDFTACFSCPLRRLYCLFLISITATIAWFSSPLDLTNSTISAFLGVKGGSNEFFTYLTVFRGVISFTYQNFLLGDRVPLKGSCHDRLTFYMWNGSFCWVQVYIFYSNQFSSSPSNQSKTKNHGTSKALKTGYPERYWHPKLATRKSMGIQNWLPGKEIC